MQYYLGTWMHGESCLSFTYGRPVESCSSLGQMYFGKRRASVMFNVVVVVVVTSSRLPCCPCCFCLMFM